MVSFFAMVLNDRRICRRSQTGEWLSAGSAQTTDRGKPAGVSQNEEAIKSPHPTPRKGSGGWDLRLGRAEIEADLDLIDQFELWVRADPGRRGLLADPLQGPGCGGVHGAVGQLASARPAACLLTGFSIPDDRDGGCHPETDGPPGTMFLGQILLSLGWQVLIVTDSNCRQAIEEAARACGFPEGRVQTIADGDSAARRGVLDEIRGGVLISVERVGPSHDSRSVRQLDDERSVSEFEATVPASERNRCHNMRGEPIDHLTGDLHRLFEEAQESFPDTLTIGIGDGGNEIGMGRFRWSLLRSLLSGPQAARVPCRIPCHQTVVAGTSNWGAYALGAAFAVSVGRIDVLDPLTVSAERRLLEGMVAAGAVDGVTRRGEVTVDGLPFLTYIQPLIAIRRALGLPPGDPDDPV